MSRFIFLILLGLAANWWWRNLQRQRTADPRARRTHAPQGDAPTGTRAGPDAPRGRAPFSRRSTTQAALPEPMVSCALCDTHLPISEATVSGDRHFCHPRHAHEYAVRVAQSGDGR